MDETLPGVSPMKRPNPFYLGLLGIVLVLVGTWTSSQIASDRDARRIADRLGEAKLQGGSSAQSELLQKTQNYYRWHQLGELLGSAAFLGGLGLTIAAGIIWYRQAQLPEPEEPEPEV